MEQEKMIDSSLSQLMDLAAERDRIEHKMGKLHLAVRGLLNLVDDKAKREGYKAMLDNFKVRIGLTDLIRLCLMMTEKPMTPVEIRNFIIDFGSESSTQQNLLQSVHTILKRMEGDLIKEEMNEDGDKAYRLVTMAERLINNGIAPISARKVGEQIEDKFDSSKLWGEAFKDEGWLANSLGALGAALPTVETDGIQVKLKMPSRTRPVGTPPTHSIGQRLIDRANKK